MNEYDDIRHSHTVLTSGWCLVLFSILFVGVTLLIDEALRYAMMEYSLQQYQLFNVASGSSTIAFLLGLYAFLPLLIIPGAVGACYAFDEQHEPAMCIGSYFAAFGAFALILSLLILPSLNWFLVTFLPTVNGQSQSILLILLKAIHSYFGIFVGDMLGLGCLLIWFFITSITIMRSNIFPYALGVVQLIIAICALLVLVLRYTAIFPNIYINIQVPAIMCLWIFVFGIGLISMRRPL